MIPIPCHRRPAPELDGIVPVWKLTDWDDCQCVLGYLTFRLFSPDGRYLFFASDRSGEFGLYRLDLEREEAVALPTPSRSHNGPWRDVNVLPQRHAVAFATPRELLLADIETLEPRVLAVCPPQWARLDATPQFSGDGTRFAVVYEQPDGRRGVAVGEAGDGPAELTSVLLRQPGEHVGYLLTSPTDRFIISVLWGPDQQNDPTKSPAERARAWWLDPATGDYRPYLVVPPGHRATHQFFGPEGRLYFHRKTVGTWTPCSVDSIDLDGGDYRSHYSSADRQLGHACVDAAGRWLITDVQESHHNELIQVDLQSGESRVLCWPNSSVAANNAQETHVHPSADYQGRQVAFQSDRDGRCGVYLAAL